MISAKLEEFKHPLDCRRKDNGRLRQDKWFTGAAWRTFVTGERGSPGTPGGPMAIAELVLTMAEDMQNNSVQVNFEGRKLPPAESEKPAEKPAKKRVARRLS